MSWDTDAIKIIRGLVNDLDEVTYTDARLKELAIIAAYNVYQAMSFETTYTISLSAETITPDPSASSDYNFIALTALKAACIALRSEAKTQANSSVSISDGLTSVSMKGIYDSLKNEADKICEAYEQAKDNFIMGNSVGGLAILSPYSPGSDFATGHDHRGFGFE